MDFDTLFQSRKFKLTLGAIGLLIVVLASFVIGVLVGYRKAGFSYSWDDHYERNFGGPSRSRPMGFLPEPGGEFMDAHGTAGPVLNVGSSTVVVNGRDGMEKTVRITSSTVIRDHRDTVDISKLSTNDRVVVIGSPNANGQIDAKLIRIFPQ